MRGICLGGSLEDAGRDGGIDSPEELGETLTLGDANSHISRASHIAVVCQNVMIVKGWLMTQNMIMSYIGIT